MGVASEELVSDPEKEEYIRVRFVDDRPELWVARAGGQGSHVLSAAANADAFAVLEVGVERVEEGGQVLLELFRAESTRGVTDG